MVFKTENPNKSKHMQYVSIPSPLEYSMVIHAFIQTVAWARKLNGAHGMQQLSNCYRLSLCCKYFIVYSHSNSPNSTVNIVLRWMVYNCMCKLYVYSTYSWGKSSGFSTKWEISFNLNSIIFNRFVYSQYGDSNALQQPTN